MKVWVWLGIVWMCAKLLLYNYFFSAFDDMKRELYDKVKKKARECYLPKS